MWPRHPSPGHRQPAPGLPALPDPAQNRTAAPTEEKQPPAMAQHVSSPCGRGVWQGASFHLRKLPALLGDSRSLTYASWFSAVDWLIEEDEQGILPLKWSRGCRSVVPRACSEQDIPRQTATAAPFKGGSRTAPPFWTWMRGETALS
jgi:hypothetical protein